MIAQCLSYGGYKAVHIPTDQDAAVSGYLRMRDDLYAVIPALFVSWLQCKGKSTLLQSGGHFILSDSAITGRSCTFSSSGIASATRLFGKPWTIICVLMIIWTTVSLLTWFQILGFVSDPALADPLGAFRQELSNKSVPGFWDTCSYCFCAAGLLSGSQAKIGAKGMQFVSETTSFNLQPAILVHIFDSSSEKLHVQGLSDER